MNHRKIFRQQLLYTRFYKHLRFIYLLKVSNQAVPDTLCWQKTIKISSPVHQSFLTSSDMSSVLHIIVPQARKHYQTNRTVVLHQFWSTQHLWKINMVMSYLALVVFSFESQACVTNYHFEAKSASSCFTFSAHFVWYYEQLTELYLCYISSLRSSRLHTN